MKLTRNKLKEIIREEIRKLDEVAKKTANQIFSSAKYSDKDISPLKIMAKSIAGDISKGSAANELKKRLKGDVSGGYYVYTHEMGGFVVFSDGSVYEVISDQGGDIEATKSKNWKSEIRKHK
jgi:gas vesicle protein